MTKTPAQVAANARYVKKTYDRIVVNLRKDGVMNGDFVRDYAESRGESVSGFLKRAITGTIGRDRLRDGYSA